MSKRLHSQANVLTLQFSAFISQGTRCDVSILLPIYSKNDVIRRGGIFVANIATTSRFKAYGILWIPRFWAVSLIMTIVGDSDFTVIPHSRVFCITQMLSYIPFVTFLHLLGDCHV